MKTKSIVAARFVWRRSLLPLLRRLPAGWGGPLQTLAHHTKMTLLHGHVIDFEGHSRLERLEKGESVDRRPLMAQASSRPRSTSLLPGHVVAELEALEHIEAELAPTQAFLGRFHRYTPPMNLEPARVHAQCSAMIAELQPDLIILIPWLVRGGADLGALLHAQAAVSAGHKVLLIATLDAESPWRSRVPPGAGFLEFGRLSRKLSEQHRLDVLTRLLLDSPASVIHIINSHLGWEVTKRHGKSLTGLGKRIYASVFSDGRDENGVMWSYPRFFFVDCWRFLSGVMCDSAWYPDDLVRQYGVSRTKLHTAYFPLSFAPSSEYRAVATGCVLWASRITLSKRPDLLIAIAKAMPTRRFEVFGYTGDPAEGHYEAELRTLPNVSLRGRYESIDAIVAGGHYAAFLYTSAWDGLPNVLLEAIGAGLPVLASAICGVPEIITPETGYPVVDVENADAYVTMLNKLLDDPAGAQRRWRAACDLMLARHDPGAFLSGLREVPGYLD